jgi:hypothetical protein
VTPSLETVLISPGPITRFPPLCGGSQAWFDTSRPVSTSTSTRLSRSGRTIRSPARTGRQYMRSRRPSSVNIQRAALGAEIRRPLRAAIAPSTWPETKTRPGRAPTSRWMSLRSNRTSIRR